MKPKVGLSERCNKNDKFLARLVRERKRINFRIERGDITRDFTDSKRIISEYYELHAYYSIT